VEFDSGQGKRSAFKLKIKVVLNRSIPPSAMRVWPVDGLCSAENSRLDLKLGVVSSGQLEVSRIRVVFRSSSLGC
jgi:hypothetical protein